MRPWKIDCTFMFLLATALGCVGDGSDAATASDDTGRASGKADILDYEDLLFTQYAGEDTNTVRATASVFVVRYEGWGCAEKLAGLVVDGSLLTTGEVIDDPYPEAPNDGMRFNLGGVDAEHSIALELSPADPNSLESYCRYDVYAQRRLGDSDGPISTAAAGGSGDSSESNAPSGFTYIDTINQPFGRTPQTIQLDIGRKYSSAFFAYPEGCAGTVVDVTANGFPVRQMPPRLVTITTDVEAGAGWTGVRYDFLDPIDSAFGAKLRPVADGSDAACPYSIYVK